MWTLEETQFFDHRFCPQVDEFQLERLQRFLLWARMGEVTNYATLPTNWFPSHHADEVILPAYPQVIGNGGKGFSVYHEFKPPVTRFTFWSNTQ